MDPNDHQKLLNDIALEERAAAEYGAERGTSVQEQLAYAALFLQSGPEDELSLCGVHADDRSFAMQTVQDLHGELPPCVVVDWDATAAGMLTECEVVRLPGQAGCAYFR